MIKRNEQVITQHFHENHRGVDLRCVDAAYKLQPVITPEPVKLLRLSTKRGPDQYGNHYIVCQGKQHVFKSIHVKPRPDLEEGQSLPSGAELGYPVLGGNSAALHEHFEVWDKAEKRPQDPEAYFHAKGIKYKFK